MRVKKITKVISWQLGMLLLFACVEQISFDVPAANLQIVIEGMITDSSGPYQVFVSRALKPDADSSYRIPVEGAKIELFDDEGGIENFKEASPGVYLTSGVLQGKIGHAYHIKVETTDGKIFESVPDILNPVGEIENIRYEFESRTVEESFGVQPADVFNIYVDADAGDTGGTENFVRWRFTGTYKAVSNPELHEKWLQGEYYFKDPFPCSGYRVIPYIPGGLLEQIDECTCCTCWANHFETEPQLSDEQLITNHQFKNVKVAEVPINSATFYDKYLVEVEQMSLSRNSFEFFKLIRAQKIGASSLFQPPSGEIKGNIKATNSNEPVVGLFWATAISRKSFYIGKGEVPYILPPINLVTEPCTRYYPDATTHKPDNWE